ncbi:MAG: hypothetical protein EU529_13945 [Promethearchaeota archaeon]|nr:MAG: hypothetical protein EU529_13945 [Candidatus Lokiarchaeota archaeon]
MTIREEFIQLSNLFNSLGIIEKGIEKIYHHLLENKKIENLKEVSLQYNLTLKRGYKICSVLSDLDLVQIYDRPMKINLANPIIPIWQKLINKRIEDLRIEFENEKNRCTTFLDEFIKRYKLKSIEATQEPVELLIFDINNIDEIYYPFLTQSKCKIATGIRYENPLIPYIRTNLSKEIEENLIESMNKIKKNLKNLRIQVVFNNELITSLLKSKEFKVLTENFNPIDFEVKNLEVHITEEDFSNFSLTDDELIQPSFDPTNKLMGSYITRNEKIYQIFNEKFNDLFEKGVPINNFISKQISDVSISSLSEKQTFALCLL